MSENLDLVRSIFADWERGDISRADWADPDIEYTTVGGVLPTGTWKGLAGMAEAVRAGIDVIEDGRIAAERYSELDGERVLVLDRRSGRMKRSSIQFGTTTFLPVTGAHLFHLRDGKVTKLVAYSDRNEALADLGLAPEGEQ